MSLAYYLLPNTFWGLPSLAILFTRFSRPEAAEWSYHTLLVCGSSLLAALLVLVFSKRWRVAGKPSSAIVLFAATAFYLLLCFGNIVFCSSNRALVESSSIFNAFTVGILVPMLFYKDAKTTVMLVCLVGSLQAGYAIYYDITGVNTLRSGEILRAGGTFSQPMSLYVLMLTVLPIAVSQVIRCCNNFQPNSSQALKHRIAIFAWSICILLTFIALVLTWYRGAILAICVGLTWLVFRRVHSRRLAQVIAVSLALVTLFTFVHRSDGPVNAKVSNQAIVGRFELWGKAWDAFREKPFNGTGITFLTMVVSRQSNNYGTMRLEYHDEPNNVFLLWVAEMGISGFAFIIIIVLTITFIVRKALLEPVTKYTGSGIGAVWLTYLVAGISDTPFGTAYRYSGNVLFGVMIGATLLLAFEVSSLHYNLYAKVKHQSEMVVGVVDLRREFRPADMLDSSF